MDTTNVCLSYLEISNLGSVAQDKNIISDMAKLCLYDNGNMFH